jgi:hypothetical protein
MSWRQAQCFGCNKKPVGLATDRSCAACGYTRICADCALCRACAYLISSAANKACMAAWKAEDEAKRRRNDTDIP